jgi:hypothetical protein
MSTTHTDESLTAHQNLWQAASTVTWICAFVLAFSAPGSIIGGLVATAVWRLGRASFLQRALGALLGLGVVLEPVHDWIVVGWPWHLTLAGFAPPSSLGLSTPTLVRSMVAEALVGPLLAVLVDVAQTFHSHTLIGQVVMASRESQRRARALQPGFLPMGAMVTGSADFKDPPGKIRLGLDQLGAAFDLDAAELAQHMLLPGASGAGKTTSLVRIAIGALVNGYAVVFVDGKAGSLRHDARRLAKRAGVPFTFVHPEERGSVGYDVCTGDPADVANKLVGSFTFGANAEIYKQIAMQALPVIVKALQASRQPVTLESIYDCLGSGGMARLGRTPGAEAFTDRLHDLQESAQEGVGQNGYAGLQFRLGALREGKFGDILSKRPALNWDTASQRSRVTYIGLPTTAAAEDVELFGRVLIQDLKQLCARRLRTLGNGGNVVPLLLIFDEFTALRDAPQIRDLLLQSRQASMPTIVVQQYLPQDPEIRAAVLQAGILMSHRVSADDAEALANELGTRTVPMLTSQVDFATGETAKGSVRRVEEYRIHPNLFRDLPVGQAVVFARPSERRSIVRIYRDAL